MKRNLFLTSALLATLALAGCGGGSSGAGPAPTPAPATGDVPSEASASPTAYVTWMDSQSKSETKEPLDVAGFVPPASDTDEPVLLR